MSNERAIQGGQSVDRALDLLLSFTVEEPVLSTRELSTRTGLSEPTARRLIKVLERREFLVADGARGRYRLGPAMIRLGGTLLQYDDLCSLSLPELKELRDLTGETASLYWMSGGLLMCSLEVVGTNPIRMSVGMGSQFPLFAGAPGRVILAHLPDELIAELTENYEVDGLTLPTAEELTGVRAAGSAFVADDLVAGAASIAVPILDSDGRPIAALDVAGPSGRWTQDRASEYGVAILDAAQRVRNRLAGRRSWVDL